MPHQRLELLDAVLHRRTGEEQDPVRAGRDAVDRRRPLGVRVLHVVGLVDDEERGPRHRPAERAERTEGDHRDAAFVAPPRRGPGPTIAVQRDHRQRRMLVDLAGPVDEHAGRAHDEEVGGAAGGEMGHRRDRLDRLAQPHLVAQHHAPLDEREPSAERLVTAQPQALLEPGGVQPLGADPLDDVGRQVPLGCGDVATEVDHLAQQPVVRRRAPFEVAPDLVGVGRADRAHVGHGPQQAVRLGGGQQRPHPRRRLVGARPVARAGEQPAHPSGAGRCGDRPLDGELGGDAFGRRLVGLAGVPHGAPHGQRLQQPGHGRVLRIEVDAELQRVPRGLAQLLGGVDRLARRTLADAGHPDQAVGAGPQHIGDAEDAMGGQLVEATATVHNVPDRLDGPLLEGGPHLRLTRDLERLDHFRAGRADDRRELFRAGLRVGRRGQHRPRRPAAPTVS